MWALRAIAVVLGSLPAVQERAADWGGGMHPMLGGWGAWGVGMMLMMLVFWGVIIVAIVFGIRWLVTQGGAPRVDTALEILRHRYARGEIDRQEFEARKRDLS
jgi:putative membrane protein